MKASVELGRTIIRAKKLFPYSVFFHCHKVSVIITDIGIGSGLHSWFKRFMTLVEMWMFRCLLGLGDLYKCDVLLFLQESVYFCTHAQNIKHLCNTTSFIQDLITDSSALVNYFYPWPWWRSRSGGYYSLPLSVLRVSLHSWTENNCNGQQEGVQGGGLCVVMTPAPK